MTRECQVRFCERLGAKLPRPTRPPSFSKFVVDFLPPQTISGEWCSLSDHKSGSRWSKSEQRGRNRMQLISIDGYIIHN
jgi:hypothetical protein